MASRHAQPQRISTPITKVIQELRWLYDVENDPEDQRSLAVVWKEHIEINNNETTSNADFHIRISGLLRLLDTYDSHIDALYPTSESAPSAIGGSRRKAITRTLRRLLLTTSSTSWSDFIYQYQFAIEEQLPLLDELAIIDFSEFDIPENERDQLIQQVTDLIHEITDSALDSNIKADITFHLTQINKLLDNYDVTNYYPLRQSWELLIATIARNFGPLRDLAKQQAHPNILEQFGDLIRRATQTPMPKLEEITDFISLPPPQM